MCSAGSSGGRLNLARCCVSPSTFFVRVVVESGGFGMFLFQVYHSVVYCAYRDSPVKLTVRPGKV